ncbi:MAG TPA: histidine kinase [Gammaproteobacteria bacterium]
MSNSGATDLPNASTPPQECLTRAEPAAEAGRPAEFFLPDFCAPRMVFAVVLLAELLAVVLALARPSQPFLTELARVSLFVQWLGLTSAGLLCLARPRLAALPVAWASAAVFVLLMANTAVISEAAVWLGRRAIERGAADLLFPAERWAFLLRNEGICLIVTAMLLRYFFVTHEWRRHVRAEARSRIDALQARIRPHFLFNSMNTIAALTRSDPARAEEAVEDLADLFRATLRDSDNLLTLKEELELARIYQRIEEARLGERLEVRWNVEGLPMRCRIPGLTLQPLLENAIYHGIERLAGGGTVTVDGRLENDRVCITVTNPMPTAGPERPGNRLALDNIRQRLELAYGEQDGLSVEQRPGEFAVTIRFPRQE